MDRSTKATLPPAKESDAEQRRLERALEEGLQETFPGSAPVNVVQPRRSSSGPKRVPGGAR
jgi:hypothetical protein